MTGVIFETLAHALTRTLLSVSGFNASGAKQSSFGTDGRGSIAGLFSNAVRCTLRFVVQP